MLQLSFWEIVLNALFLVGLFILLIFEGVFQTVFDAAREISCDIRYKLLGYLKNVKSKHGANNSQIRPLLASIIRQHRLTVHDVPKNGDCLYNAIADQLNYIGSVFTATGLRNKAVSYLRENPCRPDGTPIADFLADEGWENYLNRMNRQGEWGDQFVLQALAEVLSSTIMVFTDNNQHPITVRPTLSLPSNRILNIGYINSNHYVSLREDRNHRADPLTTELDSGETSATESSDDDYVKVEKQQNINTTIQLGESSSSKDLEGMSDGYVCNTFRTNVKVNTGKDGQSLNVLTQVMPVVNCIIPRQIEQIIKEAVTKKSYTLSGTLLTMKVDLPEMEGIEDEIIQFLKGPGVVELNEKIRPYKIVFQEAKTGCIQLLFKPKSWMGISRFVEVFFRGDLFDLMQIIFNCPTNWTKLLESRSTLKMNLTLDLKFGKEGKNQYPQPKQHEHRHKTKGIKMTFKLSKEGISEYRFGPQSQGGSPMTDTSSAVETQTWEPLEQHSQSHPREDASSAVSFREVTPTWKSPESFVTRQFGSGSEVDRPVLVKKAKEKANKALKSLASCFCLLKKPSLTRLEGKERVEVVEDFMHRNVCLLIHGKRNLGSAFFVNRKYLITCRHVLHTVINDDRKDIGYLKLKMYHANSTSSAKFAVRFECICLDLVVLEVVKLQLKIPVASVAISAMEPGQEFFLAGHPTGKRAQEIEKSVCFSSTDWLGSFDSRLHVYFLSKFGQGSSASPCLVIQENRIAVGAFLIGEVTIGNSPTDRAIHLGVKMSSVHAALKANNPDLFAEVFQ